MVKRHDYSRRTSNQGSYSSHGQKGQQEYGTFRENSQVKNYERDNLSRQHNYSNQNYSSRAANRIKADETVEDIKADISRLEKDIEFEIKEIKSLRLGL